MFAPIGYIPLSRIYSVLRDEAAAAWSAELHLRKQAGENPVRSEATAKDFFLTKQVLTAWLLGRTLNQFNTYAASPTGTVMLIEGWALAHQEGIDWYDWEWPDKKGYAGELNTPMQIAREGFDPITRFTFIDFYTGTISVKRRREWLEAEERRDGDNLSALASAIEPLDGWAVCFAGAEFPDNMDTLLESVGFDLPRISLGAQSGDFVQRGRPKKVPIIVEAYKSAFPEGHGALQREEVRRILQSATGLSFALDTQDKAIKEARAQQLKKSDDD